MAKEWIVPDADLGCDGAYFDYQELVRCGECKHWMDIDNGRQKHGMCAQLMPNWFCADGERREE